MEIVVKFHCLSLYRNDFVLNDLESQLTFNKSSEHRSQSYCAFHKRANSKVHKPISQLRFSLAVLDHFRVLLYPENNIASNDGGGDRNYWINKDFWETDHLPVP